MALCAIRLCRFRCTETLDAPNWRLPTLCVALCGSTAICQLHSSFALWIRTHRIKRRARPRGGYLVGAGGQDPFADCMKPSCVVEDINYYPLHHQGRLSVHDISCSNSCSRLDWSLRKDLASRNLWCRMNHYLLKNAMLVGDVRLVRPIRERSGRHSGRYEVGLDMLLRSQGLFSFEPGRPFIPSNTRPSPLHS